MSSPVQETDGQRPVLVSVLAGVLIALCAVLLVKWLAVAALVALALYGLVRWGLRPRRRPVLIGEEPAAPVVVPELCVASEDDCSWCGLAGGHHDIRGRVVRPRHAHVRR